MLAGEPTVLVVRLERDELTDACREALETRHIPVRSIPPWLLGEARLTLTPSELRFEGEAVLGLLFRAPPGVPMSGGFDPGDRAFADTEIGATLLAAASLPSLVAVNRFDACAWFEQGRWSVWHRRLEAAGVPVTSFESPADAAGAGRRWHPQTSFEAFAPPDAAALAALIGLTTAAVAEATWLVIGGEPIDSAAPPQVRWAATVLEQEGLALAAITVDQAGSIMYVNPFPEAADATEAVKAGLALAELFHGYRHRG
jgi:hypothetical protein